MYYNASSDGACTTFGLLSVSSILCLYYFSDRVSSRGAYTTSSLLTDVVITARTAGVMGKAP